MTESDLPLIYVNQVGGQDELVFDGASFGLHADCSLAFQLPAFRESVTTVRWQRTGNGWRCLEGPMAKPEESEQDDYAACVLGLRDYVDKNGFAGVVLGLSGGVDSALCAAIAVDALGAGARALRDAALSLHLAGIPRRRRVHRAGAGRAIRHWFRSKARSPASSRRWRRCSPAGPATSPRRTCRRGRAASS